MRIFSWLLGAVGIFASLLAALVAYGFYLSWDLQRWEKKVNALCAANGGADVATRVYETAMAPETPEYFAETKPLRTLHVIERREGIDYGPKYPYVIETRVVEVLHNKDPSVVKYTARVVRVSDNKTLSERFGYQVSGGGIPLWDPGENKNCPIVRTEDRLDVRTFLNHPKHQR